MNVMNKVGFQKFTIGSFDFIRDEYFAYIHYPKGRQIISVDLFLRALMRDVAWQFFYGTVSFDDVFGTVNYYDSVDICLGEFNQSYLESHKNYKENFPTNEVSALFEAMLTDWVQPHFDPFAAPRETVAPWGKKQEGDNHFIKRKRVAAKRMVGLSGDIATRQYDENYPINEHFKDVDQSEPAVDVLPGFEKQISAFNLFAYLSRSDVTWNPSVCSVLKDSLFCPTTEEYMLPIVHGNDRVEWFIQLSDEIHWKIADKHTGELKAHVTMKAGDIAAMPADIRHQGFSPKRSMLLVWENASSKIPELIKNGDMSSTPVDF